MYEVVFMVLSVAMLILGLVSIRLDVWKRARLTIGLQAPLLAISIAVMVMTIYLGNPIALWVSVICTGIIAFIFILNVRTALKHNLLARQR